jgi:hypothetical protein
LEGKEFLEKCTKESGIVQTVEQKSQNYPSNPLPGGQFIVKNVGQRKELKKESKLFLSLPQIYILGDFFIIELVCTHPI